MKYDKYIIKKDKTDLLSSLKALNKDIESDNVAVSGSTMDAVLNQVVSNILHSKIFFNFFKRTVANSFYIF